MAPNNPVRSTLTPSATVTPLAKPQRLTGRDVAFFVAVAAVVFLTVFTVLVWAHG